MTLANIHNSICDNSKEQHRTGHYKTLHPHMSSTITFPFTVSVGALASATPHITSHGTIGHDKTIQNNALSHAVNGKDIVGHNRAKQDITT